MNAPERTSSFLLDEDTSETKIVYTSDTKVSFVRDDCTLNILVTLLAALEG